MHIWQARTVLFASAILLVATDALAQVGRQSGDSLSQRSPAPASETDAQVLFTVSDEAGNPAPPPARESLRLRIDKQPVEIDQIRPLKNAPLYFSVLVDVSGSSRKFADQQIAAASKLFGLLSTGDNHGYLVLFSFETATNDKFLDTPSVEEILGRFPPQTRRGGTALYDAITHAAMEQLSSTRVPRNSRRAIFILSDGGDNASHKTLEQTLKVVQKEGIPIASIGFSPDKRSDSPRELRRDLETLKELSDTTGGFVSFLEQPGDPAQRAVDLIDAQYLLLFKPPALKRNKSYALKIESAAKEVHVLAPKEYFAP